MKVLGSDGRNVPRGEAKRIWRGLTSQKGWADRAACKGYDDVMFPNENDRLGCSAAKALCRRECPVKDECLRWALTNAEPYGILGGLDPEQRKSILRRRAA